jgi:hypothetical protein
MTTKWAVLLIIPIPFHLFMGIDTKAYLISSLMVFTAWIFLFTALQAVRTSRENLENIFQKVLIVNLILFAIALVILPFASLRDIMWDLTPMSAKLPPIPRLQLFSYEPSHYGLLLAPVFLFFILKILTGKSKSLLLPALAIGIPLVLTFSFGIIGAISLAVLSGTAVYFRKFSIKARRIVVYSYLLFFILLIVVLIIWPGNPFIARMENIFTGTDSSTKGRLIYAFMFARDLIFQNHAWLGVGPGQIKILAHDLIINFYQYTGEYAEVVRIPNSMGEMLATYGIYGFFLKIFFEIWFFVRLKLYRNLYSFCLFIFIFIYQFTGSFLVNAAELGTWAFVFASRFNDFEPDRIKLNEK